MPFSTITFGTETLFVTSLSRKKVPGTIKQRLGDIIEKVSVPGKAKEWQINLAGEIRGTNKDTLRSNLEALDDGQTYEYSDGLLSGVNMIIENGSLQFDDNGATEIAIYRFRCTLIQFNQ